MVKDNIHSDSLKIDILEYLKKESGEVKEVIRCYYENDQKFKDYCTVYKFNFPLDNKVNNAGLNLMITFDLGHNEKFTNFYLSTVYLKEEIDNGVHCLEVDFSTRLNGEDFKKIEKKVKSLFDFLKLEFKSELFNFNGENVEESRWSDIVKVLVEDLKNNENIEKKCIKELILSRYELDLKEEKKLDSILDNKRLFVEILRDHSSFNYKKAFLEMEVYPENEWSDYITLNYEN